MTTSGTIPDYTLLKVVPETDVKLEVNEDMAAKVKALQGDLAMCNMDKRALQDWVLEIRDGALVAVPR